MSDEENNVIDLDSLILNDEPRVVVVEGVGNIMYSPLTALDMMKLFSRTEKEDDTTFGFELAYMMLNKANPSFTYEKWCKTNPKMSNKIISALLKNMDFLEKPSVEPSLKTIP